jgi:hypothetical protein
MERFNYLLFLFLIISATLIAGNDDIVKGIVFQDLNKNGRLDPGEPGVAGVSVSNGKEVVRTRESGRWELPGRRQKCFRH